MPTRFRNLIDLPALSVAAGLGLVVFLAGLGAAYAIDRRERTLMAEITEQSALRYKDHIEAGLQERNRALARMSGRWARRPGGMPRNEWEADAYAYLADLRCFRAIAYVDPGMRVRWVVPYPGNEAAEGFRLDQLEDRSLELSRARDIRRPQILGPIDLIVGGRGFLLIHPIHAGERLLGFIVGAFEFQELFDSIIRQAFRAEPYAVRVLWEDRILYSTNANNASRAHVSRIQLGLMDQSWELEVRPSHAEVDKHETGLPVAMGAIALGLSVLVGIVVYLWQRAGMRAVASEALRNDLHLHVAERTRHLTAALNRLDHVTEEERARIARDLHDRLGQSLTSLKVQMQSVFGQSKRKDGEAQWLIGSIDRAIELVGEISGELRSEFSADRTLAEIVEASAEDFEATTGIRVEFEELARVDLGPDDNLQLYRILQESLTNVARHSGADVVTIKLTTPSSDPSDVMLEIADNGRGFVADAAAESTGIMGMRERARKLGATFQIVSAPDEGALIRVHRPWAPANPLHPGPPGLTEAIDL